MPPRIAYIVSPHGFGHAARSSAVIDALRRLRPEIEVHIFSTVPAWFWEDSIEGAFELHEALTDIGLVQLSALEEDPVATLERLAAIRPLEQKARVLASALERVGADLTVCDISPLGLVAARLAGVSSVLVESFTWDWIYRAYFDAEPGLRAAAAEVAEACSTADLRIQTEPVCRAVPGSEVVSPVYRRGRSDRAAVRARLGVDEDRPLVLVSMGGFGWSLESFARLHDASELTFVVFAQRSTIERHGNVISLPHRSPIFHPDLLAAADVVVGKLGYSTVAEAWAAGCRYLYVPRPRFPESPFLAAFVREHLPSAEISPESLASGAWIAPARLVLERSRPAARTINGADRAARALLRELE